MIPYTQFAASQEVPPPYHFPNAIVHAFIWEPDLRAVQRYCDDTFNIAPKDEPRDFVYQPAAFWPYATLLFIDYPVMIAESAAPADEVAYQNRGIISQREVFVALPVMRYGTSAFSKLTQSALEWALPFIVVQNPMSASCGREMLGLPKLLAEIDSGEGEYPGSFRASVKLPGWLSPDAKQQKSLNFLDVKTAPALPTFRGRDPRHPATPAQGSLWSLFQSKEAEWAFDALVSAANLTDEVTVGLAPTVMRTVSLRQIRNAAEPEEALYQALVSCRSHFDNVRAFSFFNENDVEITFHDTFSFRDALCAFLELPDVAGNTISIKAKAAYQFEADIDFDQMRTIYTYPQSKPNLAPTRTIRDLTSPWLAPLQGFFGLRP